MSEEKFGFKGKHEPAMPFQSRDGHEVFNAPVWGLSKREIISMECMNGLLCNVAKLDKEWSGQLTPQFLSEQAVKSADALLAELKRTENL